METIINLTSENEFLVELFNKDSLYHELTNPTSQSHYEEVNKKLIEKYGENEVETFNKEIRKELKRLGLI